ncbi:MAG: 50S ribosomal protein L17 [Candidatus Daviesbacteria bacterium]|nr:50S ribosomal protein L17 [Candidatus Daviesbacteria bacterium]
MRHRVYGKHLGRDKNQRTALFRGLIRSLFLQGSITTTETKVKAIKGMVDKLITKSKDMSEASKRVIVSTISDTEVIDKLIKEIGPSFAHRQSGFTQTVRLGKRAGDGAMLVKMSLISEEPIKSEKSQPEAGRPLDEDKPEKKIRSKKVSKK